MRGAIFDDLIARMGPGARCFAPDMPGHGSAADQPLSLVAMADAVADLLARNDLQKVILVGWSMGAAAAWQMIQRHGTARLAGLVTVDMSPRLVSGPDWPHGLKGQSPADVQASTRRMAEDWPGMAHAIAATMFAQPGGAPGFSSDAAFAQIMANDPDLMRQIWDELVAMDLRRVIPDLNLPYLVTYGQRSRVYPASAAQWLAETAPQGRVQGFAQSGHSPHLEEPAAFADCLNRFSAGL